MKEEIINCPSANKKVDKTIINEKAFKDPGPKKTDNLDDLTSETMSQEAFMKSVEEDAKKRSEDRKKRIKESDELKLKANTAFKDQDYAKALDLYNKVSNFEIIW